MSLQDHSSLLRILVGLVAWIMPVCHAQDRSFILATSVLVDFVGSIRNLALFSTELLDLEN
jgi:hypothetical protein